MADSAESSNQLIASMAVVGSLTVIGVGLLVVGYLAGNAWALILTPIGTIIGILGNSLTTPSGISKVISAAKNAVSGGNP